MAERSNPIAQGLERVSQLIRNKSSADYELLPTAKSRLRVRSILSNCLYRRVIVWAGAVAVLVCFALLGHQGRLGHGAMFGAKGGPGGGQTSQQPAQPQGKGRHWFQFTHLDGYYQGLKTLVPLANHTPDYPQFPENAPTSVSISIHEIPTPTPYAPQPDYNSKEYRSRYYGVQECFLDEEKKVPVPDTYAYSGVPQSQAEAVIGSRSLLGIRDDVCFDRFSRYGPYGLGYSKEEGGLGEGMDTEREGSDVVWEKTGRIDYSRVDWGDAQRRCAEANKQRFIEHNSDDLEPPTPQNTTDGSGKLEKMGRLAVIVRTYVGFKWTPHVILNFRAMISELSLRSGGEYQVHFLLHVRDNEAPIWADPETVQEILRVNVPREFRSMCTIWSEAQMELLYPGDFGGSFKDPSKKPIHGVYRSAHMPLQHFAQQHPEYAHFWNWELDMRYIGDYYELFDRMGAWARSQRREGMWERADKYYIPHLHGDWQNFTDLVDRETAAAGVRPVYGPVTFPGRASVRAEERGQSALPASCVRASDMSQCGVGEEADMITLNPMFDPEYTNWVFRRDITGYNLDFPMPPRRSAIITAGRLSRRLLMVMHEENWRLHHTMFSEMFPPTMALHHGLKAVYAPHPIYMERNWTMSALEQHFNGGVHGSTGGGLGSPFNLGNEHNHKGSSWYYNAAFSGLLWRRWLGYAQLDGRVPGGGEGVGEGTLRGGMAEEMASDSTGRMCMRSVVLHPIKHEKPGESAS